MKTNIRPVKYASDYEHPTMSLNYVFMTEGGEMTALGLATDELVEEARKRGFVYEIFDDHSDIPDLSDEQHQRAAEIIDSGGAVLRRTVFGPTRSPVDQIEASSMQTEFEAARQFFLSYPGAIVDNRISRFSERVLESVGENKKDAAHRALGGLHLSIARTLGLRDALIAQARGNGWALETFYAGRIKIRQGMDRARIARFLSEIPEDAMESAHISILRPAANPFPADTTLKAAVWIRGVIDRDQRDERTVEFPFYDDYLAETGFRVRFSKSSEHAPEQVHEDERPTLKVVR